MQMKQLEKTRHPGAQPSHSGKVFDGGEELLEDVPVAEPHDCMFSSQYGGKQIDVLLGGGIEPSIGASIVGEGIGQFLELVLGLGGVVYGRESIQVVAIGGEADLSIAVEVGHPLGHGEPAEDFLAFTPTPTPDLELIRMIDHGLDAQYAALLVVHFYPVFFHPMFDPCAWPSLPVLVEDFTLEAPVEFSTEEGQHILGTEAQGGMLQ